VRYFTKASEAGGKMFSAVPCPLFSRFIERRESDLSQELSSTPNSESALIQSFAFSVVKLNVTFLSLKAKFKLSLFLDLEAKLLPIEYELID
jgi:hypothetical protein